MTDDPHGEPVTSGPKPQRGDVESIDYADPDHEADKRTGLFGRIPKPDERIATRLVGHPYLYVVKVSTDKRAGPRLTELTITADDGHAVDYDALRAVPARRLAYSARQWIDRAGGQVMFPGDYRETRTRPESADPRLSELGWRIEQAVMNGEPVRATVAKQLGVSTATLGRMIRKARAENLLEGVEIPQRPQPRQRDALRARHLAEQWLDEHGPNAEPPPELAEELHRLRASAAKPPTPKRPRKRS